MAEKQIVIIGAGIVGCCTAYYLSTHPSFVPGNSTITILEASRYGAAQGASGKAGGLVGEYLLCSRKSTTCHQSHLFSEMGLSQGTRGCFLLRTC
jgi:glycine/D-amino acid oxidase-like deaminating enzyme